MFPIFAENGHPAFRGTSALSSGWTSGKGKGGGKTSIHYKVEPTTAELLLRIIVSVSQLRIYGAIANLVSRSCSANQCSFSTQHGDTLCERSPIRGRIGLHQITNLESSCPREFGAATRSEIRKPSRRSSINKSLRRRWLFHVNCLSRTVLFSILDNCVEGLWINNLMWRIFVPSK